MKYTGKLPKTADGVPFAPGAKVWELQTADGGHTWAAVRREVASVHKLFTRFGWTLDGDKIDGIDTDIGAVRLYSTKKAAMAEISKLAGKMP